jgi:hypothetical protein
VEDVNNLTRVMPDLKETIAQTGKPNTVQELSGAIKKTSERLDQKFNTALTRIANDPIVPDQIADAIESKAHSLPRTASAEAQSLMDEAQQYRQPWTIRELNAERMYRNGLARGFERKGGVAQMAAMRSSSQNMIDKIAADTARDVLYDYMERKFPGGGFRELKQKQGAILDMSDHLANHIDRIISASEKKSGAPLRSKMGISAVMSPGSIPHPFLHMPMTGGPLGWANTATRTAFGPTAAATGRRGAILAMPLSEFVTQGQDVPQTPAEAKDRMKALAPQGKTTAAFQTPTKAQGMRVPGNINLGGRPILNNPDGSVSSERSFSIGTDQGEVLIPRVFDGKDHTEQEAIAHYRKTGQHMGIFDTPEHADAYAEAIHNRQIQ